MELALPFVVIWTKNGWELIEKKHCAMFTDTYSPIILKFLAVNLLSFSREVLILESGERRSLEVGVAKKNYRSHIIRAKLDGKMNVSDITIKETFSMLP